MKKHDNTITHTEKETCSSEETQYDVCCGGIRPEVLPELPEDEEVNDEKSRLV